MSGMPVRIQRRPVSHARATLTACDHRPSCHWDTSAPPAPQYYVAVAAVPWSHPPLFQFASLTQPRRSAQTLPTIGHQADTDGHGCICSGQRL